MTWEDYDGWDTRPPKGRTRIEMIEPFDARGMRRVYGREDHHFYRHRVKFEMNIWRDRKGILFARFSTRSPKVDVNELSFAIHGIRPSSIPERTNGARLSDAWIPRELRDEYSNWMREEFGEYCEVTDERES